LIKTKILVKNAKSLYFGEKHGICQNHAFRDFLLSLTMMPIQCLEWATPSS